MKKFRLTPAGRRALEYAQVHGLVDDRTFKIITILKLEAAKLLTKVKTGTHKLTLTKNHKIVEFVHFFELTEEGKAALTIAEP